MTDVMILGLLGLTLLMAAVSDCVKGQAGRESVILLPWGLRQHDIGWIVFFLFFSSRHIPLSYHLPPPSKEMNRSGVEDLIPIC
jgi:hypothetical protein